MEDHGTTTVYIDLGLPSGILWADRNETGDYTFDEAVKAFGNGLPMPEHFVEMWRICRWDWDDRRKGYTVTGPNGNSIFLPAEGSRKDSGDAPYGKGTFGFFWTGIRMRDNSALSLYVNNSHIDPLGRCTQGLRVSVRSIRRRRI